MSPRKMIDTPCKDIRLAIQNYFSPKERVVAAERAKFLSLIQGVGESDDDFLARPRGEARYCDFENLKTAAKTEEELVKMKFLSGLRNLESKLRLLDGIKAKPAKSVTEMTENLKSRSQAMAFACSSSGNKPFTVKKEVGFNLKRTFRKPNEKITAKKSNNMCSRCGGKPDFKRPCPAVSKKGTPAKRWDTSQKFVEAEPKQIQVNTIHRITFSEKENISSDQASSASEIGFFYTENKSSP